MKFFIHISIILCLLSASRLYAQGYDDRTSYYHPAGLNNIIPPSPEASALGKYAEIPVSEFTGIPNISVPLYTIKQGGLELPVSVSYHAGGIKVHEIASSVGLGWALNAGGAITRSVVGIPDDANNSWGPCLFLYNDPDGDYCWSSSTSLYKNAGYLYRGTNIINLYTKIKNKELLTDEENFQLEKIAAGGIDGDPDLFFFNFCGITGTFVFDKNKIPRIFSDRNLKISYSIGNNPVDLDPNEGTGINSFKIIDENGTQYFFEDFEWYRQYPGNTKEASRDPFTFTGFSGDPIEQTWVNYRSAWYLTKIVSADQNDSITFEYNTIVSGQKSVPNQYNAYTQFQPDAHNLDYDYHHLYSNSLYGVISGKQIRRIHWSNAAMLFNYNFLREDLHDDGTPGYALSSVQVNSDLHIVKVFQLGHSYFTSPGIDQAASAHKYSYKRLRLDSIAEIGSQPHKTKNPYIFTYNTDVNLPYNLSCEVDFWGFYNRNGEIYVNGENNLVPKIYAYPDCDNSESSAFQSKYSVFRRTNAGREIVIDGADRNANEDVIQANMLTKIQYPTGGYDRLTYEINKFDLDGTIVKGGGLRIKSILRAADDYHYKTTTYTYDKPGGGTSGLVTEIPRFAYNTYDLSKFSEYPESEQWKLATKATSNNYTGLGLALKGGLVGYTHVSITDGNGRVDKDFSFPAPFGIHEYQTSQGEVVYQRSVGNNQYSKFPFAPNPNFNFFRGNLLNESIFNYKGDTVKKTALFYSIMGFVQIPAVRSTLHHNSTDCDNALNPNCMTYLHFKKTIYNYLSAKYHLDRKVITEYFPGDKTISQTINYGYNYKNQVKQVETKSSTGDNLTRYILRPCDFNEGSGWIGDLKNANIIDRPIEEYTVRNNSDVIDASHFIYNGGTNVGTLNSAYSLDKSYGLTINSEFYPANSNGIYQMDEDKYHLDYTVDAYTHGRVAQYHKNDNIPVSYIWGYNHMYPIAEALNAKYDEIFFDSFEEEKVWESSTPTGDNWFTLGYYKTSYSKSKSHSGEKAIRLNSSSSETELRTPELDVHNTSSTKYILSCYVYSTAPEAYIMLYYNLTDTPYSYDAVNVSDIAGLNEWKYLEVELEVPANARHIFGSLAASNYDGLVYFDDIRIRPASTQMKTYTYDPLVGVTSVTDEQEITTYYKYDSFGRLFQVLDEEGKILEQTEYHFNK